MSDNRPACSVAPMPGICGHKEIYKASPHGCCLGYMFLVVCSIKSNADSYLQETRGSRVSLGGTSNFRRKPVILPGFEDAREVERVPLWLLRNICTPFGSKQPPLKLYKEPSYVNLLPAHYNKDRQGEEGNLQEAEYRFFVGCKYPHTRYRVCRACKKSLTTDSDFEDHEKTNEAAPSGLKCTQVLIKAYFKLSKIGKCVMCGSPVKRGKWGIPLCGPECKTRFKFETIFKDNPIDKAVEDVLGEMK